MSSVNVAELRSGLVKAKHLISDPAKWSKGAWDGGGSMCAEGALFKATGGFIWSPLIEPLTEGLPDGYVRTCNPIVDYNDHPDTTHADIMALFDRAIARLDTLEFLSIANEAEKPLVNLTDALNRCWELYGVDE